jgi:hypothetical protein
MGIWEYGKMGRWKWKDGKMERVEWEANVHRRDGGGIVRNKTSAQPPEERRDRIGRK